jgi:hypothetical protein
MPGLDPLPPSGKHFCLAEEVQKVKVEGDKVTEIQVSQFADVVKHYYLTERCFASKLPSIWLRRCRR